MYNPGPVSKRQLQRLASVWEQGQHVVVSGDTGSGKTLLGRYIDEIRINAGGFVVVFIGKLKADKTLEDNYKGFTRWKKWKSNPSPHENRILLWPDTSKAKTLSEAKEIQKETFRHAVNEISRNGKWTVDFDEGYYMCAPQFMDMADDIAMLHALGRSSGVTIITKMQRPSNVPLIIYGSASHAFVGRTRLAADNKRLAELGGRASVKTLQDKISAQKRHDFLWVPVAPDWEPETLNLER